ncbi:hypothetical protein THAOC_30589 [Thalassiosira oceanica]|uniref:Uncharacterized protein n=1 Tax=Thalassiosira oceanica TaxID=159749 RepID=K0RB31_THAOC|nr:hypothetical protein THAOC_30589 [Thalassiosira oceanica]|eukprot:EJK50440.1 hypothetical protein THAOC_30589 [Thalassiosira oceanica]
MNQYRPNQCRRLTAVGPGMDRLRYLGRGWTMGASMYTTGASRSLLAAGTVGVSCHSACRPARPAEYPFYSNLGVRTDTFLINLRHICAAPRGRIELANSRHSKKPPCGGLSSRYTGTGEPSDQSFVARMADGGGTKRLKTAGDGQDVAVTAEDTELRLRRRIAELESENELLRRRGQGEGSHDVLPVVVTVVVSATRTVDLSPRSTTCIVTHIFFVPWHTTRAAQPGLDMQIFRMAPAPVGSDLVTSRGGRAAGCVFEGH